MATLRTPLRPLVRSPLRQPLAYGLQSLFSRYNAGGFLFDRLDPVTRINGLALQYEEDEGTTAVDAASDPVGLALDRSQGLGRTVLVDDDCADLSGTGWTLVTGWTQGTGVAQATTVGAGANLVKAISASEGETLRIMYDVVNVSAGGVSWGLATGQSGVTRTSDGTYTEYVVLSGNISEVRFIRRGSDFTGQIDNIYIEKVSGNHAYQGTDASRATLGGGSGNPWYWSFDGSADHLQTGLVPSSEMTIAACFRGLDGQIALGKQNSGTERCYIGLDPNGYAAGGLGGHTWSTIQHTAGGDRAGDDLVVLLRANGSVASLWVDGSEEYSAAPSGNAGTTIPFFIGANNVNSTPSSHLNGRIYRAIAINAYVSDADALLIQRQLARGVVSI